MMIAGTLIVIAIVMIFMSMKKEKYYDYEMTGCSTCSAGDAGVFDYEEMYQMPDDYYGDDEQGDSRMYEEDEIYDDTFAGDSRMYEEDEIYDDTFAGDDENSYDDEDTEEVIDDEDTEEVIDDDDDDLGLLELDAEEDDYSEL
jgi:hypothetical protein